METRNEVRKVRLSPDGENWALFLDNVAEARFSGRNARGLGLEAALRLAEELRPEAAVLVVVDSPDQPRPARIVRSRLAS